MTASEEIRMRDRRRILGEYARASWGLQEVEMSEEKKGFLRANSMIEQEKEAAVRMRMIESMKNESLRFFEWKGKLFPSIPKNAGARKEVWETTTLENFFGIPSERTRVRIEMEAEIRTKYEWMPRRWVVGKDEIVASVVDLFESEEMERAA